MYKNILLLIIVASLTITSQIFLKKGLKMIGEISISGIQEIFLSIIKLLQNKFILLGIGVAAIAAFLWLTVISKIELTTVFPISGGIFYILLFLFSWFFLGETITFIKILGVSVIIFGIFLVSK